MSKDLRTALVAGVTAAATVLVLAGAPAIGAAVVRYARNAGKVDGKHAVSSGATRAKRKGKLVATSRRTGRLPNNIIAKAPNAARLGGKKASRYALKSKLSQSGRINQSINPVHWTKLKEVPLAIADGRDAIGPSVHALISSDGLIIASAGLDAAGVSVPTPGEGIYCFDLAEPPMHVQVTPRLVAGSDVVETNARAFANVNPTGNCTVPHDDAVVSFRRPTGDTPERPQGAFFVSFMFAQP
jgi:hypothetical protein